MCQCGRAPSIRIPCGVRIHIRHDDLCLAARCLSARSSFPIHRYTCETVVVAAWKARRNRLLDFRAGGIEHKDTTETSAGGLFDYSTQGLKNGFQRVAPGRHFQNEILASEQQFRAFSVFNVGIRSEPFDDVSIVVQRLSRTEKKPTVQAVETT